MAKRISELRTANKSGNTSREYVLLSNIDSNTSTKIALNDVFPTLQSGKATGSLSVGTLSNDVYDLFVGGGVGSNTANTDKSILIFKGIKAEDTYGALKMRVDKSIADGTRQNLVMSLDQRKIDLSLGINTTSEFLSATGGSNPLNLGTATHTTGNLGVAKGGTGATTFTDGGIMIGNGTSALQSMNVLAAGSILVGAGGSSAPNELTASVTQGTVLTIDNTQPTGLKWAKPTISSATFSTTLNMNNNNIDMGTGYINGTGVSSAGLSFSSSSDYAYLGSGTKFFDQRLVVDGGITLGQSNGTSSQTIKQADCTSGASPTMFIKGSENLDSNNGGSINITAGGGQTSGNGGNMVLAAGAAAGAGTAGTITMQTSGTNALTVASNQDVVLNQNLVIDQGKTLELRGTETVTQLTSLTTAVTLNATAGVIQLYAASLSGHDSVYFTFNNTLINSRSIILLTPEVDAAEASGAGLVCQTAARAAGTVQIRISNTGNVATSTNHSVHFLIMNVYV
jgi:hypothetical protein